jgi:LysM repeat protein
LNTANSGWRQLFSGIAVALVSVATVLAGILLSSQSPTGPAPTSVALASPSATLMQLPTLPPTPSPLPLVASPTGAMPPTAPGATTTPGPTATPLPPTACPVPGGWSVYTVRAGDSIESLAGRFGTSVYAIIENNCLVDTDLRTGQTLYLPPSPTRGPTPTRVPCGPPFNWVFYRVQPGDTLYGLAVRYGTTVSALALANCMPGYTLYVGQSIYVPPVVVITPTPTRTPTPTASLVSPSPTVTATGTTPSHTPTPTSSVAPTTTPTTGPSETPSPVTPSVTHTPTLTPLPPTLTPTATTGVTPSPTIRPSATATATPVPSLTSPPPTP